MKNIFFWIGRSIIAIPILLVVLLYTGFCFKQFRYITDDEKIRIAVEYVLKEHDKTVAENKDKAVVYRFKTVDEFLASNPISCGASNNLRGGLDWVQKISGNLSSYVTLEFMSVYRGEPRKEIAIITITNCGDAGWEDK